MIHSDMLTTSTSIFQKSQTCFEDLMQKSFRWDLATEQNLSGSNLKLNIKKDLKRQKLIIE